MTVYAISVTACAFFLFGLLTGINLSCKKPKTQKPRTEKRNADVKNEYHDFLNYVGDKQN